VTSSATNARPPGGTTLRIQVAINAVHAILANHGITMPPCKVNKLVRGFCASASASGWVFVDYLSERVTLSADQRRQLLCDPDLERITAYLDPTGQTATRRVMRERGY
jgi:hypothetical protein